MTFTVLDLLDIPLKEQSSLELRCLGGRKGLAREITVADVNRPGLALSGYYEHFASERIQLFGQGEAAYLRKLAAEGRIDSIAPMFAYTIPCCIFSHAATPEPTFAALAEANKCPILQTSLSSTEFHSRIMRILGDVFAPKTEMHGNLMEIYGLGVLILGEPGVGKSETALELINRGHRLVADDSIEIHRLNGTVLMAAASNRNIGHHTEIRGLGMLSIPHLFGVGAIRDRKEIQLVVSLEEWDIKKDYDRLGTKDLTKVILGVKVPLVEVPVKPGRNIPIIIETAAMNERLKMMGYHAGREFCRNLMRWRESPDSRKVYFGSEDSI